MDFNKSKELFFGNMRRISYIHAAEALLFWDMLTIMPKKGAEARARVLGSIESEAFRLSTSDEYGAVIENLTDNADKLSAREKRMVEEASFEYTRFKKIPADLFEVFSETKATAGLIWRQAKENNDYEMFKPYLKKRIDHSRELAELWGYKDKPYDAMLESYDPALLTSQIDPIFAELLSGTRALLSRVGENVILPKVSVGDGSQFKVGEYLLKVIGYDLEAGNLYTTEHPFCSGIHSGDVRVTSKYHADNPLSSVFSVLHEGGHGIYDMNISPELEGTNLRDGASMGIHESQSRFFENILGRSHAFWNAHLGKIEDIFGVRLAKNADEFYCGINAVKPSLIRIEADELTYNLHVIIRYECEKAIFNEGVGVDVDELPELWREKYREYLGVVPETYSEGILQDSHWADADFGYFPSYAIGNLCAAQFTDAFQKQHGPIEKHVGNSEGMALIGSWLKENIHKYGKEEKPEQVMLRVCGENVNPAYFLKYIEEKINRIY